MRIRYVVGVCLALALAATGCKNEPESIPEESVTVKSVSKEVTPEKTVTEQPLREKPALEEPLRDKASAEQPAREEAASDETEYFAVFMEGKKVGHAIQNRAIAGNKVTTSVELKITLSRIGVSVSVQTKAITIETIDGKPLGFELEQELGTMVTKTIGTIDEQSKATVKTGQQQEEFDWPSGAVMSEGMRLLHLKHGLTENTTYTAKFFDPSMMQVVDVEVKVGSKQNVDLLGRVVALTEVQSNISSEQIGSLTSTEYYDDKLRLQKSITPVMGMTIEQLACTKEFALGENDVLEVVDKMFVRSPKPLENLASVKSITYHITPTKETAKLTIPSNDNQKVQRLNNKVIVTVEPVSAPAGVNFPYAGSDQKILEATKPTRFLQSDQKEIIELARHTVGRTKDAAEAIKKIEAFVGNYIENKSLSVGYASAAEVLASRQGDCSEFAVLTAAMCRAVGIPAQVVVGIAYVDDFAGHQGFGGHAWNQAYIGGKWVGLDAAFKGTGRGGYDAGHIALAAGGGEPADFLNMASILGQFKIDKVNIIRR